MFYVLADQLRSTSVLVNQNGTVKDRNYYYPYGGNRGGSAFSSVTTKRFTGQYHEQGLPGGEGLSYYNARWYDGQLGVFISADTLVPSPLAPQTLNRYAYVSGNPLRYVDPTGHAQCRTREDCADIGETPMGRRSYQPGPPGISLASHHRKMASDPYASKRASLTNRAHEAWLWLFVAGAGAFKLPQGAHNLQHYLEGSGSSQRINVAAVIEGSSSYARVVQDLKRKLLLLTESKLKHEEGKVANFDLHTSGLDQWGLPSSWQYTTMPRKENTDLYVAYNGIEWQITAHVSARRVGNEWQATIAMRVWAVDPYDWEPYNIVTGESSVDTPTGLTQEQIGDLHKAGLAREYLAIGWMDLTETYVFR